jgi:hypothetical protein
VKLTLRVSDALAAIDPCTNPLCGIGAELSYKPAPKPFAAEATEDWGDNAANLDASTLAYYQQKYGGTRLGRQELDAELLNDIEGALWTRDIIDAGRVGEEDDNGLVETDRRCRRPAWRQREKQRRMRHCRRRR